MQLELFPPARPSPAPPPVLDRLKPEERRLLIQTLARLLVKTSRPPKKGASHER
jgi:hypothetical protein